MLRWDALCFALMRWVPGRRCARLHPGSLARDDKKDALAGMTGDFIPIGLRLNLHESPLQARKVRRCRTGWRVV